VTSLTFLFPEQKEPLSLGRESTEKKREGLLSLHQGRGELSLLRPMIEKVSEGPSYHFAVANSGGGI